MDKNNVYKNWKTFLIGMLILTSIGVLGLKQLRALQAARASMKGINDLELVYMRAEGQFENKDWEGIYKPTSLKLNESTPFLYAPVWLNYFKAIKPNAVKVSLALNILISAVLLVIWIYFFKTDLPRSVVLLVFMFFGVWNGWFSIMQIDNVSLVEMLFLWAGILALTKNKIPLSMILFLLAGSLKLYWWMFGIIYLLSDKDGIKHFIIFLALVAGYLGLNYMLYPEATASWLKYIPQNYDTRPFQCRNPFFNIDVPFKVYWFFISAIAVAAWYFVSKSSGELKLAIMLLMLVIINILPRFNWYQYIFLVPVLFWVFDGIKRKEWAFLMIIPCFISYSFNMYYITFYCWAIMAYLFIVNFEGNGLILENIRSKFRFLGINR
jgi:hypothetical protein